MPVAVTGTTCANCMTEQHDATDYRTRHFGVSPTTCSHQTAVAPHVAGTSEIYLFYLMQQVRAKS